MEFLITRPTYLAVLESTASEGYFQSNTQSYWLGLSLSLPSLPTRMDVDDAITLFGLQGGCNIPINDINTDFISTQNSTLNRSHALSNCSADTRPLLALRLKAGAMEVTCLAEWLAAPPFLPTACLAHRRLLQATVCGNSQAANASVCRVFPLGRAQEGWSDWVVHSQLSPGASVDVGDADNCLSPCSVACSSSSCCTWGCVRIWRNGALMLTVDDLPTAFDESPAPLPQLGLHQHSWQATKPTLYESFSVVFSGTRSSAPPKHPNAMSALLGDSTDSPSPLHVFPR